MDKLDAIIVGPYDLSASMNLTAEFDHPEFLDTMNHILSLCNKYNIPCGDHVVSPDPFELKKRIDKGYRFLAYSTDGVFLNKSAKYPLNINNDKIIS